MIKSARFIISSLIAAAAFIGLLVVYNYFLLDSSIERIRLALDDVAQASNPFEADQASFFMQDLLVNEIGQRSVDLERLIASDAFGSVFTQPGTSHRKADAEFLLQNLLASYEHSRPFYLRWMDGLKTSFGRLVKGANQFWEYLSGRMGIQKLQETSLKGGAPVEILRRAREFELRWQFKEAEAAYKLFISQFPSYPKLTLVKIYLTSVHLRSGQFSIAEETLDKINASIASPDEIRLIETLRDKVKELENISEKRKVLAAEIDAIKKSSAGKVEKPAAAEKYSSLTERIRNRQAGGETADLMSKLVELGVYDLHLYDLAAAKETFGEILSRQPTEEVEKHAKWILGWIHLLENNYQESRRLMRELLERFPKDHYGIMSSFALAAIAERTGQFAEAAREYERLAENQKSPEVAFLLKYRAGSVYLYGLQDLSNAQNAFADAERLISSGLLSTSFEKNVIPAIGANLRDAAFERLFRGDTAMARKFFEDMLKVNPDDAWGNCGYGLALYLEGEKEEGFNHVTRCRSLKKDEYTASSLAFLTEKEGSVNDAALLYQEAIQGRPDYVVALYNLGRLEIERGDFENALAYLGEARRFAGGRSSYQPPILNNLGIAYWRLGRGQEAELQFLSALDFDETFPDAHLNLAALYLSDGKPELAQRHMKFAENFPAGKP